MLRTFVALAALVLWSALASCGGSTAGLGGDNTGDDAANGTTDGTQETASTFDAGGVPTAEAGRDGMVDGGGGGTDGSRDVGVDAIDAGRPDASRDAAADVIDAARSDAGAASDATSDARDGGLQEAAIDAAEDTGEAGVEDAGPDAVEDGGDGFVASAPDAPTGLLATAGDTTVSLTWTAPADHGSAITNYTLVVSPNAGTVTMVTPTSTSAMVTGLTNGTPYTFTVTATNGVGPSAQSAPATATPAGLPFAPTILTAIAGDQSVTLTWSVPPNNGSAILEYTVTVSQNGSVTTAMSTSTSTTVSGLTDGLQYSFTVTARNGVGTGPASAPAVATPAGVPSQPAIPTVTPGNASATVTWTMPADNGSPIQGYTVTSSPGNIVTTTAGAASTSTLVTGLTNCASYTFTVIATNLVGPSQPSGASTAVVPVPVPTVTYANVQTIFANNGCLGAGGCHATPPGSGSLTITYANIVGVPSGEVPSINYVTPGNPGLSYLWCKLNPTDVDCTNAGTAIMGSMMPLGGVVSTPDLTTIKTWIQECAQN